MNPTLILNQIARSHATPTLRAYGVYLMQGPVAAYDFRLAAVDQRKGDSMAEKGDPFEVHPVVKQAIEQSTVGLDQYFEFLKKNLASFPTGGTELGEKLKEYTDKNITSVQEFLKSLRGAKDFQDVVKIQTEFMHSQLNAFAEQAKGFAEAYTKATTDAGGKRL